MICANSVIEGREIKIIKNVGISGLLATSNGYIFVANPNVLLFRAKGKPDWIKQESGFMSTAISAKEINNIIYLAFIDRGKPQTQDYILSFRILDEYLTLVKKFEKCMKRPLSSVSFDVNENFICFSWEEHTVFGVDFFDMFDYERRKITALLYDKGADNYKIIKLTPHKKSMKYMDGWRPISISFRNHFDILCKERFQHKSSSHLSNLGVNLVKYELNIDGKIKRTELYHSIKSFDAIKYSEEKILIAVSTVGKNIENNTDPFEKGVIKLLFYNHNNHIEEKEIGFGENPQIVKGRNGQYHILWIKKENDSNKLVQRVYSEIGISKEEIIVNEIGKSKFYSDFGYFTKGNIFTGVVNSDGSILVVWEDQGRLYEKII